MPSKPLALAFAALLPNASITSVISLSVMAWVGARILLK